MFMSSFRLNMVTTRDGGSDSGMGGSGREDLGMSERDACDIIIPYFSRFITEDFPGVINLVKEDLI